MKASCPAVLAFFVNVQLDMTAVVARYTVDPGAETKVQPIAVNVALLL